jgi:hypothetical protein
MIYPFDMSEKEMLRRLLFQCEEVKKAKDAYYEARSRFDRQDALGEWKVRQMELDCMVTKIKELIK